MPKQYNLTKLPRRAGRFCVHGILEGCGWSLSSRSCTTRGHANSKKMSTKCKKNAQFANFHVKKNSTCVHVLAQARKHAG